MDTVYKSLSWNEFVREEKLRNKKRIVCGRGQK